MSLEAIKAKLLEQQAKSKGGERTTQGTGGDNASYPFWNIPEGSEATVRFLPDADPNNTFFWQKREVIKMPFEGVEGGDYPTNKSVTVTVPCVEMWGETCPIISATRPLWKDPATESIARQYWKKKSYIFQGFVVNSPLDEGANKPENPIRRFVINPSIYEIIEKSLMNPEMEDMPTDYVGGRDFKITKTKKGEYANYSTSSWSFRTRSLNDAEATAIEQYKLWNLSDYLGRRPDADELEALKAMFKDSMDGKPFDVASFGKYYRAFGGRGNDDAVAAQPVGATSASTPAASTQRTVSAPVETETAEASAPAERVYESDPAPAASGDKPAVDDILARIRNRTLNKG